MKNQKGITLVALVITIIVLLILAGVSISLVIGNNGVLTQASDSVVKNKAADAREALDMAAAATETYYYTEWAKNSSKVRYDAGNPNANPAVDPSGAYLDAEGLVKQIENGRYEIVTDLTDNTTATDAEKLAAKNAKVQALFGTNGAPLKIKNSSGEFFEFQNVKINSATGELSYVSVTTGEGNDAVTTPAQVVVSNSVKTIGTVEL